MNDKSNGSIFAMNVELAEEAGYSAAMRGLAFNKKQSKDMSAVAQKLAKLDYGHNKFLESMYVWLEVTAPRYWWQEADTFRLSTKQSESTMHTLITELVDGEYALIQSMFEGESLTPANFQLLKSIATNKNLSEVEKLVFIKQSLPEGFLQRRMWCFNYKCLRNIIIQRKNHRLPHWRSFIGQTMSQLAHSELLIDALN